MSGAAILERDAVQTSDDGGVGIGKRDGDAGGWKAHIRLDKFTAEQEAEAIRVGMADGRLWLDDDGIVQGPLGEILKSRFVPYETIEVDGNSLTRLGRKRLMDRLLVTASNQGLDSTHCRIGVGNGTTGVVDTDTDLSASSGSSNRQFNLVDSAPAVGSGASSGVGTFVSTFGTAVANFHWQEWCIDGGTANGTTVTADGNTTPGMMNRKVVDLGTKTSAASWVMTATITIT